MIKFDFSMSESDNLKAEKIICQNNYMYPDVLEITGKFQIIINETIFFSEPYFPVLEFMKFALMWINCNDKSKKMIYSSIETENNPLIVFIEKDEKWIIHSPWQKCECPTVFDREELENEILHFLKNLIRE